MLCEKDCSDPFKELEVNRVILIIARFAMSHGMHMDDLESLCKRILKINPKIRFVGVISNKGKLLESRVRKRVTRHVTDTEQEMLFMETALRWLMRPEYDEKIGPVDFSVVQRRKVIMMGFLLADNILCVSTDLGVDISKITKKISTELYKKPIQKVS
jgi:hypothetical protein